MDDYSAIINKLRTVTFTYNGDITESKEFGLIAEEVEELLPDMIIYDDNKEPFTVKYEVLPILMLKEMQKQQLTIEELKNDNAQRDAIIQNLLERITSLEARA